MIDVETRAHAAGRALRAEAADRVADLPVPGVEVASDTSRARRRFATAGLVAAVGIALIVAVASPVARVSLPTIDPVAPVPVPTAPVAVDGVLPVPPVGEVVAAYLDDGTPVFVTHPADGDVHVVGALNPHGASDWGKLVAYCPSSGWFEDLHHGSRFNAWGDYTGGPAPSALDDHVSELATDGRTVQVTGEVVTRPRDEPRAQQPQRGPNCAADASEVVLHAPPADVTALAGGDVPADRWVWARIVLGGTTASTVACDPDGRCPADAPALAVTARTPEVLIEPEPAVLLVRATPDGIAVTLPARPDEVRHLLSGASASPPAFPLPEIGQAAPHELPDGTPVFVARDLAGDTHVLDASSRHRDVDLVSWCATSGRFGDRAGAQWSVAGQYAGGPAAGDLRRYPSELADVGEVTGVRVTGPLGPALGRSDPPDGEGRMRGPNCPIEDRLRHLPGEPWRVFDIADGGLQVGGPGSTWAWVRMTIAEVDGQLRLCTMADRPCGAPGDPDTGTTCFHAPDDAVGADDGDCLVYEDPVVITGGAATTDGPQLLLVRGSDDTRTVEVRHPAEYTGH